MREVLINFNKKNKIHYTFLYIFLLFKIFKYNTYNKNILNYNILSLKKVQNILYLINLKKTIKFHYIYTLLLIKNYKNLFIDFKINFIKNNKILLFLECKVLNIIKFKSNYIFKNLNKNQLFFFDSFSLRIDFSLFIHFKRYLEYFRMVKYNEYLTFNQKILKKKKLKYFLRNILYKGSLIKNFHASILSNKIIIYKSNLSNKLNTLKYKYNFDDLKPLASYIKKLIFLNKLWTLKFLFQFKDYLKLYLYFWVNNYIQTLNRFYSYQRISPHTLKENYIWMIIGNFNFFDIFYSKFIYTNIKNIQLFDLKAWENKNNNKNNISIIASLLIIEYIDKAFFKLHKELCNEEYNITPYTFQLWALIKEKYMLKFVTIFNEYTEDQKLTNIFDKLKYTLDLFILKVFDFIYVNNDWDLYYYNHINLIDICCIRLIYTLNIFIFFLNSYLNKYLFIFQNFFICLNNDFLLKNEIFNSFINKDYHKLLKDYQYKYFFNQHLKSQYYQIFFNYYNNNLEYYYKPTGYFKNRF